MAKFYQLHGIPVEGSKGLLPRAARDETQLRKFLLYIGQLSGPLNADLEFAMDAAERAHDSFQRHRNLQEICFWGKVTTSCLFAHMDAVGCAMRRMVQLFHTYGDLTLSTREVAKLAERRYDKEADALAPETSKLSTLKSFKLGVKYFCKLLGADFKLATGDERWVGVRQLAKARNRFTHPKEIEDLYAFEMFGSLQASVAWYFSEMRRLFRTGARALGITDGSVAEGRPPSFVRPKMIEAQQIFTASDMERMEKPGGPNLEYVTQFFKILQGDALYLRRLRQDIGSSNSALSNFAARAGLRTECSQVEATSAAVQFLLRTARGQGQIDFPEEELVPTPGYSPNLGRLVSAVNLWSRKLGPGRSIKLNDETIVRLAQAWEKRDQLVHPKQMNDLAVDPLASLNYSLAFADLGLEVFGCLEIDRGKWAAAYEAYERSKSVSNGNNQISG